MRELRPPISIGLIGAGGIAGVHADAYLRLTDQIRVVAVSDISPDAAEARAAHLGARPYRNYREMLSLEDLDAVDICLPHHLHAEAIIAAARAGKHILCEKPLCLSLEEAAQVRQAVQTAGVTLMCAHNQLFMPAVAEARRVIASGEIGKVYEVRTTDAFRSSLSPANAGWRAATKTNGGGELIDTGYHPSYLLLYLAGGRPVEVTAMLSTHRLSFLEAEDSAQLLVRFDNGVVGNVATSWAYQPAASTERFSAVGSAGSLRSDGVALTVEPAEGQPRTVTYADVDTFVEEIAHFASCIRSGARPLHTEVEGAMVLAVITAAYRSSREGIVAPVDHQLVP